MLYPPLGEIDHLEEEVGCSEAQAICTQQPYLMKQTPSMMGQEGLCEEWCHYVDAAALQLLPEMCCAWGRPIVDRAQNSPRVLQG